jgi:PEP-CTERM motif
MKLKSVAAFTGLLAGSVLALSSTPAQAFSFTTNLGAGSTAPKGDIWLDSVELGDGSVINNFSLVNTAKILYNDPYSGGNSGAASSDIGDNANGAKQEAASEATVVASLGNTNLNNIIDTEDNGTFKMNLFFDSAVDMLFFWERGMNSRLGIQAIDANGNLLGNFLQVYSKDWDYAGFGIDTKEIVGTQQVGSLGISLADLGVSGPIAGIQLLANGSYYNGPDFKVVGSSADVPEPATLAGIGLVAGAMALSRRRKASQQA